MSDFQHSSIYHIYIKSFQDSNGDGIGDLPGIISRLDYLRELGISCLWITPFYKSPQKDNGYDVADYRSIDPVYGTMADFERLVQEAEKRGIGLMLDMVFNHTSTDHEWFQRALAGEETYKDYYIWRDAPTNWESKFGGSAWEYVPAFKQYYLHLFDKTQADLNWENPKVRAELRDVLRFWMEKGVKGFRFDVVNLISKPDVYEDDFEGDGRRFYTDGPRVHEHLKELCAEANVKGMVMVGEMSSTSIDHCVRYSKPDERELSMCFSFHHLKVDYFQQQKWSLQEFDFMELKRLLNNWQLGMQEGGGWNALFWSNHDQPRVLSRFGDDKNYPKASAQMLAAVLYLMRGTPYLYQGEEIGMTNAGFNDIAQYRDVESINHYHILRSEGREEAEILNILAQRSRDNARTPMQWDGGDQAGFTTGTPWLAVNPNHAAINVAAQGKADSILAWYQQLIRLRKELDVVALGAYRPLLEDQERIFAYTREHEGQRLLVLANFYGEPAAIQLELHQPDAFRPLLSNYEARPLEEAMELRPYETLVYVA